MKQSPKLTNEIFQHISTLHTRVATNAGLDRVISFPHQAEFLKGCSGIEIPKFLLAGLFYL